MGKIIRLIKKKKSKKLLSMSNIENIKSSGTTVCHNDCYSLKNKLKKKKRKNNNLQLNDLRQKLRHDSFYAQIPRVLPSSIFSKEKHGDANAKLLTTLTSANIAFDVYKPNSNYRRNNPGIPDYCVAIMPFSILPHFEDLVKLLRETDGVPLRLATV